MTRKFKEKVVRRLQAFLGDEAGGMLVFMATLAVPLVIATGLAIDAGRGYLLRARLGDAIDAAGLAATMVVTEDQNFESDFQQFFYANFPSNYLDATITLDTPQVSDDQSTITYSVSATIDTTFMRVAGINTMTVSNSTEVTRMNASLDLAISMDMSGSMDDDNRIEGARSAATSLVDILFGADTIKDNLKIGVVPWNSKVNVTDGTSYDSSTTEAVTGFTNPVTSASQSVVYMADNSDIPLLSEPDEDWQGCVYARYSNDGDSDNDADLLLGPVSVGGADWPAWQPIGPNDEPEPDGDCDSWDCGACPNTTITRLTNDRDTIEAAIEDLINPDGHTNIVQGLVWAYRVVSPGEPFDDSESNPGGNHQRAIVLLTDGEQYGNRADAYNGAFGSGTGAGEAGLDDRLTTLADYIKSQGVEIYTIQYFFDDGPLATLMKDVATEPDAPYYHFAPDAAALDVVFDEIADHLSSLRLSK